MNFKRLPITGVLIVEIEEITDERGFFARTWCHEEAEAHGLEQTFLQQSISYNAKVGTIRGLHYQAKPHQETKLVRCTAGSVFDVVVDLRPASPSYRNWHAVELSSFNHSAIYIPKGIAHGFQTLTEKTELFYEMTVPHTPSSSRGIRWDDAELNISWPLPPALISESDLRLPGLCEIDAIDQ